MTDSFETRIAEAERQVEIARATRDRRYPGSAAWEIENAKMREWEDTVRELRRQRRNA